MSKKIKVIIADDEPAARVSVEILLSKESDIEIVAQCKDGKETVAAIERFKPDLVFLDIQMPEMNGFEVLDALNNNFNTLFIMITAYDQYAIKAFEKSAIDYLLKPYDDLRFYRSLDKVRKLIAAENIQEQLSVYKKMLEILKPALFNNNYPKKINLKINGRIFFLPLDTVKYIESEGNFVKFVTEEGQKLGNYTFKQLNKLVDPKQFIRIHKSFIVNKNYIDSVEPHFHGDYVVHLKDGYTLRMSRNFNEGLQLILD